MHPREIELLTSQSFFLFGARGTGKSTLLRTFLPPRKALWLDLLAPDQEAFFAEAPQRLSQRISAMKTKPEWVVIDEVQKIPKLLDVVHAEIEQRKIKFALTGSSARRLKRGGVNLLAGRAFVNHLFPLTFVELGDRFRLDDALAWGTLPFVVNHPSRVERKAFLQAYVDTYLKEEILQEQVLRNVVPFRKFLAIASQLNGTLLNYSAIAADVKVDWATVRSYYEVLEDTLLGFTLPAFHRSVRKQQLRSTKFYLFDVGIRRALDRTLSLAPSTSQQIGPLFEHLVIAEIYRLNSYYRKDFELSYLATQGGLEVDLVIDRPGQKTALVEIKSSEQVTDKHLRHLEALIKDNDDFEAFCLCRETQPRQVGNVSVLPWQYGIAELGLTNSRTGSLARATVADEVPAREQAANVCGMSARRFQAPGPFRAAQLRSGDPYELSRGHALECLPVGPRHGRPQLLGGATLWSDPAVTEAGVEVGYSPHEDTLRAPDVAVANVPDQAGGSKVCRRSRWSTRKPVTTKRSCNRRSCWATCSSAWGMEICNRCATKARSWGCSKPFSTCARRTE